ncbi:MAG: efflux RND transporter periplasmic adaptor subunit [Clostridiales bacterium]|nr:efflux RND transporter periplasmic adaptor subunit [Clostridiales bacterium]
MKKKSKWVVALAAAILAGGAGGYYALLGSSIEVSAVPAAYGTIEKLITETGSVEARNSVVVSSKIQGQLSSLDVAEGDAVTEGQRIAAYQADSGAADIGSMRAQISGLQVQLNQANEMAAKNKRLYDEGAVSFEEYNQATVEAKQIQSQIAAINYTIAGLSEAGGSKGVIAPISGTVTSVLVNEGEIVAPGTAMIEITDAEDAYIKVNLISEDADEIAQDCQVRVFSENEKLIDENATVGKIFVKAQDVMSDLGISQKRVPVEVVLSVEKNLRLGSNVNVEIVADKRENVLTVPENAVFEINRQQYVFTIEDGKAKLTRVQTGLEGEKYIEVVSGLAEGDLVITSPAKEIEDGKAVNTHLPRSLL